MVRSSELAAIAAEIQAVVNSLGMGKPEEPTELSTLGHFIDMYDVLVTCAPLRSATRQLFSDGHYARAVEEACKSLNNSVQDKSGEPLDGVALMQRVFTEKDPVLRLNNLRTTSQRDEQSGYMMILSGLMRGVRNPRAHDHKLMDSPTVSLELLILINHLWRTVEQSKRRRNRSKSSAP